MPKPTIKIIDCSTGEVTEREMTADEIAASEATDETTPEA
jgi:hypothetical protein